MKDFNVSPYTSSSFGKSKVDTCKTKETGLGRCLLERAYLLKKLKFIPSGIYLLMLTIETLEQGVKYV